MDITRRVAKLLVQKKKTLAVAESCTGGMLANSLTNITGSSKFFTLGIIPYDTKFKSSLLKIPKTILKNKGAVSKETALLMARNTRNLAKSSYALAITGIAGPTGATSKKPVGLTYIALSTLQKTICKKLLFRGPRLSIKTQATKAALNLLLKNLQ